MSKTQPARGMRDFLPADVRRREYVMGVVREVYERYGFEPLETPAVENIETLTGKYGEEGNQLIFKILKRGEGAATGAADLALRYDLTVPLARVVAEYGERLPKFFKRYQMQPVWRADRPARGRFREFYQCDVDAIGSRSMIVEAELCAAASDALTQLGFTNFTIRLNHRQVLAGVLEQAGVDTDKQADALVALDKLDKIGAEGVAKELSERGVAGETGAKLLSFFAGVAQLERATELVDDERFDGEGGVTRADAFNAAMLGRLIEFLGEHEAGASGVDELRQILQFAGATGAGARVKIDPSLARGLSYYTGAIMEISVPDLAGSLGGGGRYDDLVGMFSKQQVPACGFSLGLERIIVVMTEREMFPSMPVVAPADVMVAIWNADTIDNSIALANELRNEGLRVYTYPEADKTKKQFKYASERYISFVALIGPDEQASGEIALKDMRTGQQRRIKREDAAEIIHNALRIDISQNIQLSVDKNWNAEAERIILALGSYRERSRFPQLYRIYLDKLPILLKAINMAFIDIKVEQCPALVDKAVLSLNKLCVSDFESILMLCLNGHGYGASQIVSGMYERVVTSYYLHLHPELVDDFFIYWTDIEDKIKQITISDLQVKMWNDVKFREMAVEGGMGEHFRNLYLYPKLYAHPSRHTMLSEWEAKENQLALRGTANQTKASELSLWMAYFLTLKVIEMQVKHFNLNEDEPVFQQSADGLVEILMASQDIRK